MTKSEWWDVIKTGMVILYGILGLLSVFGPLAQYSEYLVLAASVVSIIGAALGVTLTKPATQMATIKERKASGN